MLFRVVDVDNLAGEGPGSTERFITEPISSQMADVIADALNEQFSAQGFYSPRYYQVVPEDYKLFIFEP